MPKNPGAVGGALAGVANQSASTARTSAAAQTEGISQHGSFRINYRLLIA